MNINKSAQSKVWYHNARSDAKRNRLDKLAELIAEAGLVSKISRGDLVAIKLHWGEPGNVGHLPPPYVRPLIEAVRAVGGKPFLTDTNTLYTGLRRNAVDHVQAAAMNGFSLTTLGVPVVVADGLKGFDGRDVSLAGGGTVKIASAILDADAMLVFTHVKGHMLFAYGGALKNLGMGCTTPAGKQFLHSDLRPVVQAKRCTGCGDCIQRCPTSYIALSGEEGSKQRVARIDKARCIGCGECTATCLHGAIPIRWASSPDLIQTKTAECALAALAGKQDKVGFVNCMINLTPDCDCCDWNDPPFMADVGFLASTDPVAVDVASADLVAAGKPIPGSMADGGPADPWRAIVDIDYRVIFAHGEKIGLGRQAYQLVSAS